MDTNGLSSVIRMLLIAIAALTLSPNQSVTLAHPSLYQIAYEQTLSQNDICIINMDGSDQYCLMETDEAFNSNPVWSPDGRFIAYSSETVPRGSGSTITSHIYDVVDQTTVVLAENWYIYDWSPDGQFLLAVRRERMDDDGEIYLLRPHENETISLTNNEVEDYGPLWSPDGSQIAYLSGFPDASLMVMTADGTEIRVLVAEVPINREVQPQWSPDSSAIAFVVNTENVGLDQPGEVYVIDVDSSNLRQLTSNGGVNINPRWSPDGTQIVFYGYALGAFDDMGDPNSLRTEIFLIDADGSNLLNLSQSTGLDYHPSWSPDGEWIAFASTRASPGIFIMRPDGSDVRMVTNEPPFAEGGRGANNPVWRPVAGGGG